MAASARIRRFCRRFCANWGIRVDPREEGEGRAEKDDYEAPVSRLPSNTYDRASPRRRTTTLRAEMHSIRSYVGIFHAGGAQVAELHEENPSMSSLAGRGGADVDLQDHRLVLERCRSCRSSSSSTVRTRVSFYNGDSLYDRTNTTRPIRERAMSQSRA
jgi:hypothetical protein